MKKKVVYEGCVEESCSLRKDAALYSGGRWWKKYQSRLLLITYNRFRTAWMAVSVSSASVSIVLNGDSLVTGANWKFISPPALLIGWLFNVTKPDKSLDLNSVKWADSKVWTQESGGSVAANPNCLGSVCESNNQLPSPESKVSWVWWCCMLSWNQQTTFWCRCYFQDVW